MDLGISDRVALVVGAGGGLGGSITHTLAREGAMVAACDINAEALTRMAAAAPAGAARILPIEMDLADHPSIDAAVARATAELGPVSILINNTGGPPPTPAAGVPVPEWRRWFDAMVASVFHLTDLVLPGMRERGWGRVVTSTSFGVVVPIPNLGISNALRTALLGWSKTLAGEVGRDGVTVNVVVPGKIATARAIAIDEERARRESRSVEEVVAETSAGIALGRYGTVEEYGEAVAWLTSERAAYVTGSVLRVDGGLIASI